MTKLSALFVGAGIEPDAGQGDAEISSITADSRSVKPGALFICMPSDATDSHRFIPEAVSAGAVAVLVHSQAGYEAAKEAGVAAALVNHEGQRFSELVWRIGRGFYNNPSRDMRIIGVTGTNGKTTTAWLIRDMLLQLQVKAAYLGTLGFQTPAASKELANTTPFSVELLGLLAEARDSGVETLAMEVSSHALDQRRVDGIDFDAAVFTNLTQDHLDYHGTMEEYANAKFRLFRELGGRSGKEFVSALNIDDPYGRLLYKELGGTVISYSTQNADLTGVALEVELERLTLRLTYRGETREIEVPLGGSFNVQNCLSAAAGMLSLGFGLQEVAKALPGVRPVPGRFEPVRNDEGIGIIVDYAHTPDALEKLLESVRSLRPSRVVTIFGCGGDRDRSKRPKMGKAASEGSDAVVLTSDNPRTEDPGEILKEIEAGLKPGVPTVTIEDRREAIGQTVKQARPGDVIVIAGKGHETYQIIGREKMPMDDREIAREALAR